MFPTRVLAFRCQERFLCKDISSILDPGSSKGVEEELAHSWDVPTSSSPAEAWIPGHAPPLCLRPALHLPTSLGCRAEEVSLLSCPEKVLQLPSWAEEGANLSRGFLSLHCPGVIQSLLGPGLLRKLGCYWHPLSPRALSPAKYGFVLPSLILPFSHLGNDQQLSLPP